MFILLVLIIPIILPAQTTDYETAVQGYIERYQGIAVQEMAAFRIPASITLAQGIFESNAGRSRLATEANNHFGIKCHKEWTGKKFYQDDETKNECFRKYDQPEESFRDHSLFLTQRERYRNLFSLDISDYKGWAKGLKDAGYATNPQYADKLIATIERFRLYRFDDASFALAFTDSLRRGIDSTLIIPVAGRYEMFAVGPGNRNVFINNGLQFILLQEGDNIGKISVAFGVPEKRIWKWNDMKKGSRLVTGQMVYLEPKKRNGAVRYHAVEPGETMYTISQKYGIKLNVLYKKNGMKPGRPVQPGHRLKLR